MEVFLSIVLKQKQFTCTNEIAALPIEFTIIMEWNVHFVTLANLIFLSQIAVLCNIRISLKLRFFADSFLFLQQKKVYFFVRVSVCKCRARAASQHRIHFIYCKKGEQRDETEEKNECRSCNMKKRNVKVWKETTKAGKNGISCYTTNGWIEIDIQLNKKIEWDFFSLPFTS